jgi:hypothetical protein
MGNPWLELIEMEEIAAEMESLLRGLFFPDYHHIWLKFDQIYHERKFNPKFFRNHFDVHGSPGLRGWFVVSVRASPGTP